MVRTQSDGRDLGLDYLAMCVQSWRDAGFQPYTINSQHETLGNLPEALGVERLTTTRDAREAVGKPLVYITDFLQTAGAVAKGPFAIVNADILVELTEDARTRLIQLTPGECGFFNRVDIAAPTARDGATHHLGFDLFCFHADDVARLDADRFVLGVPWWDHFLPVVARLNGLAPISATGIGVYHLQHDEAWDEQLWLDYGMRCRTGARQIAAHATAPGVAAYRMALRHATVFSPRRPRQAARSLLRSFSASGRRTNQTFGLYHLGRANVAFINGTFEQTTLQNGRSPVNDPP